MTHTQGKGRRAVAITVAVTAAALTGCTSASTPPSASPSATVGTVTRSTENSSTSATTSSATESSAAPATALACGTPPKALVERAGMSIAAHPGTITATSYVFAATTDTGDWYVLGVDRAYVHDDGSPAEGPDGDHSRSLALTNLARTTDGEVAMIPLSVAVSERLPISWDLVSWTGETLAAGRRAAQRAMDCLDEQG